MDELGLLDVFLGFFNYFFGEQVEVLLQHFALVFELGVEVSLFAESVVQFILLVKGLILRRIILGR